MSNIDKTATNVATGLATAGAANAIFGRNKKDGWGALGVIALLVGFLFSVYSYAASLFESASYKGKDRLKVALLPVGLLLLWYYSAGALILGFTDYDSMWFKPVNGWWHNVLGISQFWLVVAWLLGMIAAGYGVWDYLRKVHERYGNKNIMGFGKHLLCSISITFIMFGIFSNTAEHSPKNTYWSSAKQLDDWYLGQPNIDPMRKLKIKERMEAREAARVAYLETNVNGPQNKRYWAAKKREEDKKARFGPDNPQPTAEAEAIEARLQARMANN